MTRLSPREIERALEDLQGESDEPYHGPTEIVLRHHTVGTGHSDADPAAGERELDEAQRLWRDAAGEWHSETIEGDHPGDSGVTS